jgi:CHAT domain-containing protein
VLYGDINYDTDSTALKIMANAQATYTSEVNFFSRGAYSVTNSWNPLPGTKKEVTAIAKFYSSKKVKSFTGNAATEESFKSLSGKSPSVIHLATHGFFFSNLTDSTIVKDFTYIDKFKRNDNPLLRSGLILAGANLRWRNGKAIKGLDDGILTSYEISLLDLTRTNLAILSACETGLGDIEGSEGVYGLQRAFKMAGLEYLVMSLWKVPDIETAEFMQEFHRNIFLSQTVTDAFYHAQSTMKNKYQSQPYKWAAWVLVR